MRRYIARISNAPSEAVLCWQSEELYSVSMLGPCQGLANHITLSTSNYGHEQSRRYRRQPGHPCPFDGLPLSHDAPLPGLSQDISGNLQASLSLFRLTVWLYTCFKAAHRHGWHLAALFNESNSTCTLAPTIPCARLFPLTGEILKLVEIKTC